MVSPGDSLARPVRVSLHFEVEERPERWLLEEEDMPETPLHDEVIKLLVQILEYWAVRDGRDALVARNLGCRWDPEDARVGMDPDVALIEPSPPRPEQLSTLRVWEPGHRSPRLAVEVVSEATADKDYLDAPARGARLGLEELVVFDPLHFGPGTTGGPFVLQLWSYAVDEQGRRVAKRIHAGAGPAFSPTLGAWLVVVEDGSRLRVADDRDGARLWPTAAEAARAQAEREAQRADQEAQRAAEAEAELARLRRELSKP